MSIFANRIVRGESYVNLNKMPWQHVTEGINIYTIDLLLLNRAEGNTKLCMFPILLRKFIVQSSINIRHYRNQSIFYNYLKKTIKPTTSMPEILSIQFCKKSIWKKWIDE